MGGLNTKPVISRFVFCDIILALMLSRRPATPVTRVLLRLPTALHRALTRFAAAEGLSFNEFCVRRLGAPARPEDASPVRTRVIERAREVFGDRLLGIVVVGSWARGDAAAVSDIDVLVVVDPATPLTRDLYRAWDERPLAFEGRAVDAHFLHPSDHGAPTAVWCEAAVDGVTWYDREGRVASRLAEVRRAIADGRVVRGIVHGQPYWKGVA